MRVVPLHEVGPAFDDEVRREVRLFGVSQRDQRAGALEVGDERSYLREGPCGRVGAVLRGMPVHHQRQRVVAFVAKGEEHLATAGARHEVADGRDAVLAQDELVAFGGAVQEVLRRLVFVHVSRVVREVHVVEAHVARCRAQVVDARRVEAAVDDPFAVARVVRIRRVNVEDALHLLEAGHATGRGVTRERVGEW